MIITNRRITLKLLDEDMKCQNAFMPSKSIRKKLTFNYSENECFINATYFSYRPH